MNCKEIWKVPHYQKQVKSNSCVPSAHAWKVYLSCAHIGFEDQLHTTY